MVDPSSVPDFQYPDCNELLQLQQESGGKQVTCIFYV